MATPAYLGQIATFYNASTASVNTMTTTQAASIGTTIFVAVRTGSSTYITSVTDSAGNTYRVVAQSAFNLNVTSLFATVVTSTLASGQTITVTGNTATSAVQGNAIAFSNIQLSGVSATAQAGSVTSVTVGSVTPQQYSGIVLSVASYNNGSVPNISTSGYTKLTLTGTQWMGIAWKPIGSITAESVTWTQPSSTAVNWGATLSALNATSGEFFSLF